MGSKTTVKPRAARPPNTERPTQTTADSNCLYLQVAHALKDEIIGGTYPVGARLPTEDELRERFNVSRHTVREALRRLREDGLVESRQGAGTVVISGNRATDAYAHDVMSINDLVSWSADKRFAIDTIEMITLDETLATRTGLQAGQAWLAARGLGHAAGLEVAVCSAEYYIHRDFAAVGRLLRRHTGPIFPLIEDRFGVKVVEVHQDIGATLITDELASALKVACGSAALEVRRTYKLPNGQAAQVTVSTHPATRYQHSMTLRRIRH